MRRVLLVVSVWICCGCGSRSEVRVTRSGDAGDLGPELCNGLDDDGNAKVDDPFRDARGRYIHDEHCGACNQACTPASASELETHCRLIDELPRCSATRCTQGHAVTRDGHCARVDERVCLACASDDDCGSLTGSKCASIGGESRCSVACVLGCPDGYSCDRTRDVCVPLGGSCSCEPGQHFDLACALDSPVREPGTPVCVGRARCDDGKITSCQVSTEVCDEQDNDCDGEVDEDFRDELGAYALDPAHCGQCGASCLEDTGLEQKLVCGGDPFAPRCVLSCPDALDGVMPGDRLDGDLDIATGCECVVRTLADLPGPVGAQGASLDENCDGADGIVRESFYVAVDGDDSWPGSPTRPLRSLTAALARARESLATPTPRAHVFVASGSYTETLRLEDGVQVHGGYRRDFRALDPAAFLVEVRATRPSNAPGGAALVGIDVGVRATRVEWLSLRGLDATDSGAALGAYLERPGRNLVLSSLTIRAGVPAEGGSGDDGAAGQGPAVAPRAGDPPRAAREDAAHACVAGNQVRGGSGGRAQCAGSEVRGGDGGSAACPSNNGIQPGGQAGSGPAAGAAGQGGQDSVGPIASTGCGGSVCCGLADFSVPTNFQGPSPGQNGAAGRPGNPGVGCQDGLGRFVAQVWSGASGQAGNDGQPGSGGGGAGSGGGVLMNFTPGECEFEDGLGGGGGGGGAGGCGGRGGQAGQSGAPSVAMLIVSADNFTIENVVLATSSGGRGGTGGAGGDGGAGDTGAAGGSLPLAQRTTPTLAGPFPGARGGSGGSGGSGGGGGGGCGGASVGLWIVGGAPSNRALWARNRFELGPAGNGGAGGDGAQAGGNGAQGEAIDVVVQ